VLSVGLRLRLPSAAACLPVGSAGRPAAIAVQELLQRILDRMRQSAPREDKARPGLL